MLGGLRACRWGRTPGRQARALFLFRAFLNALGHSLGPSHLLPMTYERVPPTNPAPAAGPSRAKLQAPSNPQWKARHGQIPTLAAIRHPPAPCLSEKKGRRRWGLHCGEEGERRQQRHQAAPSMHGSRRIEYRSAGYHDTSQTLARSVLLLSVRQPEHNR